MKLQRWVENRRPMDYIFPNLKMDIFQLTPTKIEGKFLLLQFASLHDPIQYPKPDGIVSFDVPTSLYRFVLKPQTLCSYLFIHDCIHMLVTKFLIMQGLKLVILVGS